MQPRFAGWAMVEHDSAGKDPPKPRMAMPHPIKKEPLGCSARPLGAQLWLGVAQTSEQGAQRDPHPSVPAALCTGGCAHGPALPSALAPLWCL